MAGVPHVLSRRRDLPPASLIIRQSPVVLCMDGRALVPPHTALWYPTVHVHYWVESREGRRFFYDAWWRTSFGPGSVVSGYALDRTTGTPVATWAVPGGVGMRTADAKQLAEWAPIGALISIRAGA